MPTTIYTIKFVGHLKEFQFLPSDSPELVDHVETDVIVEVEGLPGLKNAVEANTIHIMRTNMGMICRKKLDAIQSAQFVPDEQYFVPLHMISHITTVTRRIVGRIPDEREKGNTIQ